MKFRWLVTHGERENGPNPSMTRNGSMEIERLKALLPQGIVSVVIGTGRRFQQVYNVLLPALPHGVEVKRSPFCGSADGIEPDGRIILVDGTLLDRRDYLGLINTPGFDAWAFIKGLPLGTLLCAGGELMIALGQTDINEKGQLFELDPDIQTARKIS